MPHKHFKRCYHPNSHLCKYNDKFGELKNHCTYKEDCGFKFHKKGDQIYMMQKPSKIIPYSMATDIPPYPKTTCK